MIATRALLSQRRVVVTGIGAITPLGNNFQSTWQNILSSDPQSSIGITSLEEAMVLQQLPSQIMNYEISLAKKLPSQVAAPVRGVDYCPRTTRFVQLALLAAKDGILNSGLDSWLRLDNENDVDNEEETQMRLTRIGTCIGSGMSSVREVVAAQEIVGSTQSLRRLSPHFRSKGIV
jgi:3-oxoacyl-[acyl-carrier-protein] synthase II